MRKYLDNQIFGTLWYTVGELNRETSPVVVTENSVTNTNESLFYDVIKVNID